MSQNQLKMRSAKVVGRLADRVEWLEKRLDCLSGVIYRSDLIIEVAKMLRRNPCPPGAKKASSSCGMDIYVYRYDVLTVKYYITDEFVYLFDGYFDGDWDDHPPSAAMPSMGWLADDDLSLKTAAVSRITIGRSLARFFIRLPEPVHLHGRRMNDVLMVARRFFSSSVRENGDALVDRFSLRSAPGGGHRRAVFGFLFKMWLEPTRDMSCLSAVAGENAWDDCLRGLRPIEWLPVWAEIPALLAGTGRAGGGNGSRGFFLAGGLGLKVVERRLLPPLGTGVVAKRTGALVGGPVPPFGRSDGGAAAAPRISKRRCGGMRWCVRSKSPCR